MKKISQLLYRSILKIKGDRSWECFENLKSREFDGIDEIKKRQLVKLKRIIDHAWKFDVYKKLWGKKPVINKISDMEKLLIITKKDFRGYSFDGRKDSTSGSTGEPFEFFLDKKAYENKKARGFLSYSNIGLEFGDKFCILWGFHSGDVKGSIYRKFLQRVLSLSAFEMDDKNMHKYVFEINKYKPKIIQAYTSAIYSLAKFMKRNNLSLEFKLRGIITSGETPTSTQRKIIEDVFNTRIINRYGSREFGCIAQECEYGNMHMMEDFIVEEKNGNILVTDLNNFSMPFIRYEIGDCGYIKNIGKCKCGRHSFIISELAGRVSDFILCPSGKIISLHYLTLLFQEYYEDIDGFQVIQKSPKDLDVRICKTTNNKFEELKKTLETETGMNIKLIFVKNISLTNAGKRRIIEKID